MGGGTGTVLHCSVEITASNSKNSAPYVVQLLTNS